MVLSSFISSILVLSIGIWAYFKLESTMNLFTERQLLIEPSKFSYKMWKDMPVSMYQSFTFFNLTNWNQVKSIGQKPRFVEVGPYVYKTIWTKSEIQFLESDSLVSFSERKQWHFQQHLSRGYEDDLIWTINTPLMTALALIQNAPVITRNIVSVILDGLGEGAFIKRPIKSLLFEGYSDLIVSVGPLFDRRFSNFNGKFAYLYNKNDSIDGIWTVSTGVDDISSLNKINRFQSTIYNISTSTSGQAPQGLNEVKTECASAWGLDRATNGQLFAPFNEIRFKAELEQHSRTITSKRSLQANQSASISKSTSTSSIDSPQAPAPPSLVSIPSSLTSKTRSFFSRSSNSNHDNQRDQTINHNNNHLVDPLVPSSSSLSVNSINHHDLNHNLNSQQPSGSQQALFSDLSKYIFYPDLCRPLHLLAQKQEIISSNDIKAHRYTIDPRIFMNSTQQPSNKCYEMNPRPPLANALAATINSVTGANVQIPSLVTGASSPFSSIFNPNSATSAALAHNHNSGDSSSIGASGLGGLGSGLSGGIFERANHPNSFLNNALSTLAGNGINSGSASSSVDANGQPNGPLARLSRVRQLFTNIVSQRMSAPGTSGSPGSLLQGSTLLGNHNPFTSSSHNSNSPNSPNSRRDDFGSSSAASSSFPGQNLLRRHPFGAFAEARQALSSSSSPAQTDPQQLHASGSQPAPSAALPDRPSGGVSNYNQHQPVSSSHSDRWITQFRFKWPRGVFSIGQCQLGAPIYASLPHFLDADEYYLDQVDGLKPNRSLHEFYIDIESSINSIPVNAKARLQLNVATPELRFRNIPNAMIPVLWQEVTFEIDKPVATMLYWSFTMSGKLYTIAAILITVCGVLLFTSSIFSSIRKRHNSKRHQMECRGTGNRKRNHRRSTNSSTASSSSTSSSRSKPSSSVRTVNSQEDIRQHHDWQGHYPHHLQQHQQHQSLHASHPVQGLCHTGDCMLHQSSRLSSDSASCDTLSELRRGAALNRAFCSSDATIAENLHNNNNSLYHHSITTQISDISSTTTTINNGQNNSNNNNNVINISPKQPSSRASSHCELMIAGSNGNPAASASISTNNCTAGCLLACLRHSQASINHHHIHNPASQAIGTMHNGRVSNNCNNDAIGSSIEPMNNNEK